MREGFWTLLTWWQMGNIWKTMVKHLGNQGNNGNTGEYYMGTWNRTCVEIDGNAVFFKKAETSRTWHPTRSYWLKLIQEMIDDFPWRPTIRFSRGLHQNHHYFLRDSKVEGGFTMFQLVNLTHTWLHIPWFFERAQKCISDCWGLSSEEPGDFRERLGPRDEQHVLIWLLQHHIMAKKTCFRLVNSCYSFIYQYSRQYNDLSPIFHVSISPSKTTQKITIFGG